MARRTAVQHEIAKLACQQEARGALFEKRGFVNTEATVQVRRLATHQVVIVFAVLHTRVPTGGAVDMPPQVQGALRHAAQQRRVHFVLEFLCPSSKLRPMSSARQALASLDAAISPHLAGKDPNEIDHQQGS
jgi:hypothetical protein